MHERLLSVSTIPHCINNNHGFDYLVSTLIFSSRNLPCSPDVETWNEEPCHPNPSNMTSHICKRHHNQLVSQMTHGTCMPVKDGITTKAQVTFMDCFCEEGRRNPAKLKTRVTLLDLIAEWLIMDDLAFTVPESPHFHAILKFLNCPYAPPSDTTV